MTALRTHRGALGYTVAGALAASLLAGCTGGPRMVSSAGKADPALAGKADAALGAGKIDKALSLAEAAVRQAPTDAAARLTLAQAYLKAGRFQSAATTFRDAAQLGDTSARTTLGMALSYIASGNDREATAVLHGARDTLGASDLGLALALAGETREGVAVLSDALRAGDDSAKLRQNLAYAYALDGRWREARLMVSQDLPADQVDARLGQWALSARPDGQQERVAALLGAPLVSDPGQPTALALATSAAPQLAEAVSDTPTEPVLVAAASELPALDGTPGAAVAAAAPVVAPVAPPVEVAAAAPQPGPQPEPAAPTLVERAVSFASSIAQPVIQALPWKASARVKERAAPRAPAARVTPAVAGSHLAQLGAFSSLRNAERAKSVLVARNPALKGRTLVVTQAVVRGKTFWRVSAAGLNGTAAQGLCASVKAKGSACFAYSAPVAAPVPQRRLAIAGPSYARR